MAEHPIQGLMNVTMDKIRQMADSNTIIGKPIKNRRRHHHPAGVPHLLRLCVRRHRLDGKNAANKDLFGGAAVRASTSSRWLFWW